MNEVHLICRDLHHAWKYSTVKREGRGFIRRLFCISCTTVKLQKLDNSGYILETKYKYPEGYVREPGTGRITKAENAEIRLTNLKREGKRRA